MTNLKDIRTLADLMELEAQIASEVQKHPLDGILLALRAIPLRASGSKHGIPPHVIGAAARFATRFGVPGPITTSANPLSRAQVDPLLRLAVAFAHADPCAWIGKASDSVLPLMLRHVGNQFPYLINPAGKWGRAEILFNELPNTIRGKNGVPNFDFDRRFKDLTGVSVSQFIDIGYLTYCAAASGSQLGFTRGFFEKARQEGLSIPDDETTRKVLSHFAADSAHHSELSEKYKQTDRNYAAYDFSSLFVHPLIRPWPSRIGEPLDLDRMIAPIPDLILFRMTSGIYYDMQDRWRRDFNNFFGHLLNAYVGRVLRSFVPSANLISEDEIRKTYPASAGKVADWMIVDRRTAILIEVKVARIHRLVYATGDETKLDENLSAVHGGLRQMYEFRSAVSRRTVGLERLFRCNEFVNIVITLEPTYLANSDPFKERLRSLLDPPLRSMKWAILSLEDLEWFQVHLSDDSIDLAGAFRHALGSRPDVVINSLAKLSGRTFSESMLRQKEEELWRRLGLPLPSPDRGGLEPMNHRAPHFNSLPAMHERGPE